MAEKSYHTFEVGVEYKCVFKFEDPKGPYTNDYDKEQWLYTVEVDGNETKVYASFSLHKEIQEFPCKKDKEYYICQARTETGEWIGWLIGETPMDKDDKLRFQKRQLDMLQNDNRIAMSESNTTSTQVTNVKDSSPNWDDINLKKRFQIAHGQSFNISAMTVNGAEPTLFDKDPDEWARKINRCASVIYPYLCKDAQNPNDELPF